jgi:uncharacterized protein (DUF305 family)
VASLFALTIISIQRNLSAMRMQFIFLIGAFLFVQVSWAQHEHAESKNLPEKFIASKDRTYNQLINECMAIMHRDMHAGPSYKNPDIDFAVMMIPHHQGAVDMAKSLLLYGKDPEMRNLALQIITDQQTEIDQMKSWLKRKKISLDAKGNSK